MSIKRKLLPVIFTLLLPVAMTAITSCGSTPADPTINSSTGAQNTSGGSVMPAPKDTTSSDDTGTDETPADPTPAVKGPTKETDFSALISDKVTEEEWNGAFSSEMFDNVTIDLPQTFMWDGRGESATVWRDNGNYCINLEWQSGEGEGYGSTVPRDHYTILNTDTSIPASYIYDISEKDEFVSTDSEEGKRIQAALSDIKTYIPDLTGCFSYYTYDETNGLYVCHDSDENRLPSKIMPLFADLTGSTYHYSNSCVMFKDGKLAYFYGYYCGFHVELYCYDYGTTVIPTAEESAKQIGNHHYETVYKTKNVK